MAEDVLRDCRTLFDLMRRFWSAFGHQLSGVLSHRGINVPQYMAMVALEELGGATMGKLSKRLHVTMGASTNIVDKLVRAGYVSRLRSEEDRRVVNVKLERKGRRGLQDIEAEAMEFMTRVLVQETPETRRQFLRHYERMVALAEAEETTTAPTGEVEGASV